MLIPIIYRQAIRYLTVAAISGGIGVLCTRTYFKKKYEEEAERRINLELSNRLLALQTKDRDIPKNEEQKESEVPVPVIKNEDSYIQSTMTLDQYHDYTQYYAEPDYPSENDDYLDEAIGEEITEDHKTAPGPRIMEWEEIGARPDLDDITLLWHVDEGWMETEDGEKIDDPANLVGDCLVESGFFSSNRQTINIINERRGETYEVTKIRGRSML